MAEEDKDQETPDGQDESSPKKKKGLMLGGGVVGLVGVAYFAFLMAVPSREEALPLQGPFVAELTPPADPLSVNLSGGGSKNYLVLKLKSEFVAYDEAYVTERIADPLFQAMLTDKTILVTSQKAKEDLTGSVGKDALREELRAHIDPILFPVHIGESNQPTDPDEESGLRPGSSRATMRGPYYDHELVVDALDKTLQLDAGDPVPFEGGETDLAVGNAQGERIFVDVSGLESGFVGKVNVGVHGAIRKLYFSKFLVQ